MRGFSSRTKKNSSAPARLEASSTAAAAIDKKVAATRPGARGPAPRIKSNLGATHAQLDGGYDQHDSHRDSYPCFGTGKKSTGVDQMPYADDRAAAGIIHNAAIMRPIVLRTVERDCRQRGQSPGNDMTDHVRAKKYPLEEIEQQRRQYGPQDDRALGVCRHQHQPAGNGQIPHSRREDGVGPQHLDLPPDIAVPQRAADRGSRPYRQ